MQESERNNCRRDRDDLTDALALLGEEGRTEYLVWLKKKMSHQTGLTDPAWLEKFLPSSDPPEPPAEPR